jgi:hypothetical protein
MLSYSEDYDSTIHVRIYGETIMELAKLYEVDENKNSYSEVVNQCRIMNALNKKKEGYVPIENVELWQCIRYRDSGMYEEIRLTTIKVNNKRVNL